jgi:hypothetical protein
MSEPTGDTNDVDKTNGDDEIPFDDPAHPEDEDGDRPEDRVDPTDMMSPPKVPCECYCLHCHRTFMSDGIWFQKVINARDGFAGFWMCPTPNCDGAGFTFDIFPTDPTHPSNGGWSYDEDEDDEDLEYDENGDVIEASRDKEYDPDESKYKALDEELGDVDEDIIEGDEWKLGLEPGARQPESDSQRQARLEWEEEQKRYDGPDERPRILDWKDREDRGPHLGDDDIPF